MYKLIIPMQKPGSKHPRKSNSNDEIINFHNNYKFICETSLSFSSGWLADPRSQIYADFYHTLNYYLIIIIYIHSAFTATVGDILGQMMNKQASYDLRRTIAFALFG